MQQGEKNDQSRHGGGRYDEPSQFTNTPHFSVVARSNELSPRPFLMKLATYKDGSRDGQLIVVSRDLTTAHYASGIASRLQQVLDDWNFLSPQLQDVYDTLNHGKPRHAFAFDPKQCMAPLPRAYQWVDGSAYINHVALVRQARGAEMPPSFYTDPLMYQGGSDGFLGPCDDVICASEAHGIDFEAEVAVITSDVRMGSTPEQALDGIRLVMLANDVSVRHLIPGELAKGFGLPIAPFEVLHVPRRLYEINRDALADLGHGPVFGSCKQEPVFEISMIERALVPLGLIRNTVD